MITVHHIGTAVLIIVGDPMARSEPMRYVIPTDIAAHEVIMLDSCPAQASMEVVTDLLTLERSVVPFPTAVLPRRVRWLALLGLDEHQQRVDALEQPLNQRRGTQPSPSWRAAMLARQYHANNLVTKPAWRARVPCYSRVS